MDGELNYYRRLNTGVHSIPGSAESVNVSRVFLSLFPADQDFLKEQGGEAVDHGKSTPERVTRRVAQALSQESCQKRDFKHGSPQALVRFEK
jgi:hypothetical protein